MKAKGMEKVHLRLGELVNLASTLTENLSEDQIGHQK